MDIFTRFNRKSIDDRKIDTLIGMSKGLLADGRIDPSEAQALYQWLTQSQQVSIHPILANLLIQVEVMLSDGIVDRDELAELFSALSQVAGEPAEFGEIAKSASLPLCKPTPIVTFPGKLFLFTGTCAFGTRMQCQEATERLGGTCGKSVTKNLHFLVIGAYVTDSWAHESFGRKIEKAMEYRTEGVPLAIVSEETWVTAGGLR